MDTWDLYGISSRQYQLWRPEMAAFLSIFRKHPLGSFFENVNDGMQYSKVLQIMLKEYVNDAKYIQVKGTVETLRPCSFMEEKETEDVTDSLTKIIEHMNDFSLNSPLNFARKCTILTTLAELS